MTFLLCALRRDAHQTIFATRGCFARFGVRRRGDHERRRNARTRHPVERSPAVTRLVSGGALLAALVLSAMLDRSLLGREAIAGGSTTVTTSTSRDTSTETVTTTETERVDTQATRLVAIDPVGALVSDATFPVGLADGAVQSAITAATTALLAGPPASLFVKGPALVATTEVLLDSDVQTVETGRMDTETVTLEERLGPDCTGIGDRDVPNTAPCGGCTAPITLPVPPAGTPFCVAIGTINLNENTHTHTVIQELRTTTETYLTTKTYALRGSFLDHFVFYKVKGSAAAPKLAAFGPVTLTDALGAADYDVTKLPALGLPADKNAEGRADATTALAQYAVKRRKGAPKFQKIANVATTNQCGALTLTLTKPESLLVPVKRQTDPFDPLTAEVDHLLCYKAKAATKLAKGTQVDVVDEFQTRRYDLKKPTRLCVPVATAGTPITKAGTAVAFTATARRHPAGHLVCYQAKAASKTIAQNGCGPVDPKSKGTKIVPKQPKHAKQLGVAINGPLGPATLDTAKEVELCIPSTAVLP